MKKLLSLIIPSLIVFNLTSEIFAQSYTIKGIQQGHSFLNYPKQQEQRDKLLQEIEKHHKAQTLSKYESDYQALLKIFAGKTYLEVITDANYFLNKQDKEISYDGRKYERVAVLHAALHNLATRQKAGYQAKKSFVGGNNKEAKFGFEEKLASMDIVYRIIRNYGYNKADEGFLYKLAIGIVENGKELLRGFDFDKTDILPSGLISAESKQKAEQKKDKEIKKVISLAKAMAILPVLSITYEQKKQSAQAVYDLGGQLLPQYRGIIIRKVTAETLIALGTRDSLEKLTQFVNVLEKTTINPTEDMTRVVKDLTTLVKGEDAGLGQYFTVREGNLFIYPDPLKDKSNRDENASIKSYQNVVYTSIMEDIGKALGRHLSNKNVKAVTVEYARYYLNNVYNKKTGLTKHSLMAGVLAGANNNGEGVFISVAKVIYDGSWWDINEATQRDKNNIAARFLNRPEKTYNDKKYKDFAKISSNSLYFSENFTNADKAKKALSGVPEVLENSSI